MKATITGAILALATTTAGAQDVDINSANVMLPHCRAMVAKQLPFSGSLRENDRLPAICAPPHTHGLR
jgi:hypothetical protein